MFQKSKLLAGIGACISASLMIINSGSAVRASADRNSETIVFDGSTLNLTRDLQDTLSHTVYEDRQVPDTCYERVVVGYETQCHTEYDRVCHTETRPVCRTETRRECDNTTRRECYPETRRECDRTTRRECSQETKCHDVPDQICHTTPKGERECRDISRRECNSETVCRDVPDEICRTYTENVCRDVPDQICRTYDEQVCRDESEQVCETYPREACEEVPVYEDRAYACTRTERVPVGTEIDLETTASVQITFSGVPTGTTPNETMALSLRGDQLTLAQLSGSGQLLLLVDKRIEVRDTGTKRKHIDAVFTITVMKVVDVTAPLTRVIEGLNAKKGVISATLGAVNHPETLSLQLKITKGRDILIARELKDIEFTLTGLSPSKPGSPALTQLTIDVSRLELAMPVTSGKHEVTLTAGLKPATRARALNAKVLPAKLEQSASKKLSLK